MTSEKQQDAESNLAISALDLKLHYAFHMIWIYGETAASFSQCRWQGIPNHHEIPFRFQSAPGGENHFCPVFRSLGIWAACILSFLSSRRMCRLDDICVPMFQR
jgi:hypothetical protein